MTAGNLYLGSIEIKDIPPAPRGIVQLEVRFDVDSNMDITVSAKDRGTGREVKTTLKSVNGIPDELFEDMCKKVSIWKSRRKII
jgi:molecular chaperone DnaK